MRVLQGNLSRQLFQPHRTRRRIKQQRRRYPRPDRPYNLVLELKKDGVTKEATQTDVGFREVEITDANTDDARLRVNGKVITITGVNRHENNPQDGWYLTEEDMRKDIELMKWQKVM